MFDLQEVLKRIKPDEGEVRSVHSAVEEIMTFLRDVIGEEDIEVRLVGSVAKGTFLKGPDIDVFLLFPEHVDGEYLEKRGLEIGTMVLGGETRYAEHPYTHGVFRGYDVDIVPCYRIRSALHLRSNVDRTPFHTEYIRRHLPVERRDDVLLLKAFMKGIGVYGAEVRIEGFSGYLCELLVIRYGTFHDVLKAASGWNRGEIIHVVPPPMGLEKWKEIYLAGECDKFRHALNVVDPVDHSRNVASAVSDEKLSTLVLAARDFLSAPSDQFFFPPPQKVYDREDLERMISRRGSAVVVVSMPRPDVIDDVLFSQVKKCHLTLRAHLERNDFRVINSIHYVDERIDIAFELESAELPLVKKHLGPPTTSQHALRFADKWRSMGVEVTVEGSKLAADVRRKHTHVRSALEDGIRHLNLGKYLNTLANEAHISIDEEAMSSHPEAISRLIDRTPPWRRK